MSSKHRPATTIRHELSSQHDYEFVEGCEVCPIAPEIKALYPSQDTYYSYYERSKDSFSQALRQLHVYILEEGPFDGVIAFSQGASLITAYLLKLAHEQPNIQLPFRCAILFSSAPIPDPLSIDDDEVRVVNLSMSYPSIALATGHIWGRNDTIYKSNAELAFGLYDEAQRQCYTHEGGHEIPGPRDKEDIQGCVRLIRRVIERATAHEG